MKRVLSLFVLVAMAMPLARLAMAQVDAPAPQASPSQGCPGQGSASPDTTTPCVTMQALTMALHDKIGQTIDERLSGNQALFVIGPLGGYDTAFDSKPNLPARFAGGRMYTGALIDHNSSFALVENTATVINYSAGPGTTQYLDTAALSAAGSFSPSVAGVLDIDNTFGNDAIRVLAPEDLVDTTELASYGIHAGKVLDSQAETRMIVQGSATRQWTFSVRNVYRDFFDDNAWANTIHGGAVLRLQPSDRTSWGPYEETSHESGIVDCTTEGVGLLYERKLSETVSFDGAAGPTFGSSGCFVTVTANFYAGLAIQPWQTTTIYVSAFRKLNDSGFTGAVYENSAQGGLIHNLGLRSALKAQGGWVQGRLTSSSGETQGSYESGSFQREVGGGFTLSVAAQHYQWSGVSNIAPTRTLVIASLSWSPMRRKPESIPAPQIP